MIQSTLYLSSRRCSRKEVRDSRQGLHSSETPNIVREEQVWVRLMRRNQIVPNSRVSCVRITKIELLTMSRRSSVSLARGQRTIGLREDQQCYRTNNSSHMKKALWTSRTSLLQMKRPKRRRRRRDPPLSLNGCLRSQTRSHFQTRVRHFYSEKVKWSHLQMATHLDLESQMSVRFKKNTKKTK